MALSVFERVESRSANLSLEFFWYNGVKDNFDFQTAHIWSEAYRRTNVPKILWSSYSVDQGLTKLWSKLLWWKSSELEIRYETLWTTDWLIHCKIPKEWNPEVC